MHRVHHRRVHHRPPRQHALFTLPILLVIVVIASFLIGAVFMARQRSQTALPEQLVFDPSAPVTLNAWNTIALPGAAHPHPSFSIGSYYYVHLQSSRKILVGKQQADGSLSGWTDAFNDHGGIHGFTAVATGNTAYHFRNGHVIQYVIDSASGKITSMPELEKTPLKAFPDALYVWDTAVPVSFPSASYIFHLGGFNEPNGAHQYNRTSLHRITMPIPSSNAQFTKLNDLVPTNNPDKAAFYLHPSNGYGYIYMGKRDGSEVYKLKVNSDGSVGTWETASTFPAGSGNKRGDLFVIGSSLFSIRGSKVYQAAITPDTGALSAWADDPPDLPEEQIDSNIWNMGNTEGASYGIIGDYVYVTGRSKVFYAKINGNTIQPPEGATNTPVPAAGNEIPIVDFSSRPENKAPVTRAFGVTLPVTALSTTTANELSTLFSGLNVTIRLTNPSAAVAQDTSFSTLHPNFQWYFTFASYDAMKQFLTAYYGRADAKPVTVGLTAQADATQTQAILTQFPQVKFDAQEFGIWPRDAVKALLGRVAPPTLNAVSFTLNKVKDPVFDDVKILFDTMFDAVKDIAGGSTTINYPANTNLTLVDTKFASTLDGIARKTGVLSGAIVASIQGPKTDEAPIRTILAGDFAAMSAEEKPIIRAFAQFIFEAPQVYYPWTHPGNGEPFDKGEGNIKPAWGIAGIKNGKVYAIFTNTSDQPLTLKFPDAYTISNTEPVYSTTRGSGAFIQNNRISLGGYETIAIVSGITTAPGATATPLPPGVPTATPVPSAPTNTPTITLTPKPTKTPRPSFTPRPVVHRVMVTIPVMAVKLGAPTESQSFLSWLSVVFQFILPGRSPTGTPTPTAAPTATPVPPGFVTQTPTPTPFGFNPTATPIPMATATPAPLPCNAAPTCPYGAPNCFITLDEMLGFYPAGDPPPPQHPDLNISKRGYQPVSSALSVIDVAGSSDPKKPPQLDSLFQPARAPQFQSTHQIFDPVGTLRTDPDVTLVGLAATIGERLYPPVSDHNIGDNVPQIPPPDPFQVYVLYADQNRITLKYDRNDSVVSGYTLHIDNICTDTNLLALYNSKKQYNTISNRTSLIALRTRDSFGTARTGEVIVATRANGSFLDPRTRKNWWRGY